MSRKTLLFFCLFVLSRIPFINPNAVFFDSPEYLRRLAELNFWKALTDGHIPLHSGYILIFWFPYQIARFFKMPGAYIIILLQIVLAFLALLCFYKLLTRLFDSNIAIKSVVLFACAPLFWITNVTIMMETAYVSFFIFFLYFHSLYAISKKPKIKYLLLGNCCLVFSFLTHTLILLWLPFYLVLMTMLNKKRMALIITSLIISLITASTVNAFFISGTNLLHGLNLLYLYKLAERAQLSFNFESFLVFIRNSFIPLFRNYTFLITLLSFLGLFQLRKNKRIFILFFLWIIPLFVANQWWDSLLYGRHSLIAGMGISVLVVYVLQKRKSIYILTIIYLLIVSFPALSLLKNDIPYLLEKNAIKNLPKQGLLIETHFARPQIENSYHGEIYFVDEPREQGNLVWKITDYLNKNLPVFVSSQALSEPYGLYSGPYLHVLSLSYKKEFLLKPATSMFVLKEYRVINRYDDLIIYQITSSGRSYYPKIPNMLTNRRRIDYYDPFVQIWLFIKQYINTT